MCNFYILLLNIARKFSCYPADLRLKYVFSSYGKVYGSLSIYLSFMLPLSLMMLAAVVTFELIN